MTLRRLTLDPATGYAYIYLTEPRFGIAKTGVPLALYEENDPEALRSLVLDFDSNGKLVGIDVEVRGPASKVLRPDLIASATTHRPASYPG
jgi:uncharacterized protein YuzE